MELVSLHLGFAAAPGFAHNWLTRLQQGVFGASLVSFPYPALKTAHRVAQVRVWIFSPKRVYPPPKGGGAGYRLFSSSEFSRGEARCFSAGKEGRFVSEGFSGSCLWQLLATTGSHGFNRAGVGLRWCCSLTRPPKPHTGPHGGEFGFGPLAGACQEDCPPFRQSRVKNRAEEKTPLPCFSKIEPVKFVIPCKRFSKPPGENPFSLFMRRRFCAATGGPPGRMLHGIFAHKQRTRPFHGRVLVYHLILWRDGSPSPARSNLYATASWMGRIVYRSTPFCTLPSLPWTVVFSVSMSLFSSNRCTYFRTVLGLIPVHWPIRLKLGQH